MGFYRDMMDMMNSGSPGSSRNGALFPNGVNGKPQPGAHQFGTMTPFGGRAGISNVGLENVASALGGTVRYAGHVQSTDARELDMYDYKQYVYARDILYLSVRDPTAMFLVEKIPNDLYRRPPKLPATTRDNRELNNFLAELKRLRYFTSARAAHKLARRDGGAFVFIRATGDPSTMLTSDEQIRGFQKVPLSAVLEESVLRADRRGGPGLDASPLIKGHGIESLILAARDEQTGTVKEGMEVHGSRLQLFNEEDDPDPGDVFSASTLLVNHDDLWNWRDILVSKRNAQIQGNPIAVDIDVDNDFSTRVRPEDEGTDHDPNVVLDEEMQEWQYFGDQHFSAIEGAKLRRVGPAELEPAEATIASITERIAQSEDMPVGMVFPTALDSVETNAEKERYYGLVERWHDNWTWYKLDETIRVGQELGMLRRLIDFPVHLRWPDPQYYNKREWVFVRKSQAQAARDATIAGRELPADVRDDWEEREEPPPASQMAQRANEGGRPPGAQDGEGQPGASIPRGDMALRNEIERIVEDKLEEREEMDL